MSDSNHLKLHQVLMTTCNAWGLMCAYYNQLEVAITYDNMLHMLDYNTKQETTNV